MAAPAVRIAVVDLLLGEQRAVRFQDFDDDGVAFPDGLAEEFFGEASGRAFGMEEAASGIDGAINRDAVLAGRRRSLPGHGRARCGRRRCPVRA